MKIAQESSSKGINDLQLHERLQTVNGDIVTRVPGGWIYTMMSQHNIDTKNGEKLTISLTDSTFVPEI